MTTMKRHRIQFVMYLATALMWAGVDSAYAQYKIDSQNPLDNNLKLGGSRLNNRKALPDYTGKYNDSIVTSSGGGLGRFRGRIGYRAPGEFRGSGGGVDSPSFQFQRRNLLANSRINPQINPTAGNVLYRSGSGVTAGQLNPAARSQSLANPLNVYRNDVVSGNMVRGRVTTESYELNTIRPTLQNSNIYSDASGNLLRVNASPLTGLQTTNLTGIPAPQSASEYPGVGPAGIDPYSRVGEKGDGRLVAPAGSRDVPTGTLEQEKASLRFDTEPETVNPLRVEDRVQASSLYLADYLSRDRTDRVSEGLIPSGEADGDILTASVLYPPAWDQAQPGEDAYQDLLRRVRGPGAPAPPVFKGPDGAMTSMPSSLTGTPSSGESYLEQLKRKLEEAKVEPENQDKTPSSSDEALENLINKLDYDLAPLATLAGSSSSDFDAEMRNAEEQMAAGKYFDANNAYQRASRLRPGHPSILVGRVNAQVGAGLFASATIDLRRLLTNHPELVAARYREPLLPSEVRLAAISERLKPLLASETPQPSIWLLAYIAYQRGDNTLVGNALDSLTQWYPEDPLLPLLERIWIDSP
jgi:hypothetical protein